MSIQNLFNSQTKTITSAAIILTLSGFASRLLGLIRDRIFAGTFGAGDKLDMYYAAFQIPDFIYSILFMGAITAAFLPVFTEYWSRDQKEAWHLTNVVLNSFLLILIVGSFILLLFTPQLIDLVAPGFEGAKREITINLTRIMFLSPLFLGISNILGAALQGLRRFFVYSLTPIMYNIGIIFGALFLVPFFGIYGLAFGVVLGAVLHLSIQIPSIIISGFRYRTIFDFYHKGFKKIITLMIPRTIGLAANQINVVVMTAIASTLASGSITVFNLAKNLYYLPIGLFGISFATAAFPSFSEAFALNQKEEFKKKFLATFNQILFLVIPISVLIYLLRAQIVRLILGTGKFGWIDTRLTAAALGLFALSIFAHSLIPLISRAFFAMKDTKTPVFAGILSFILNIFLAFYFVWLLGGENFFSDFLRKVLNLGDLDDIKVLSLPLSFSVSIIFDFFVLFWIFKKRIDGFNIREIFYFALKISLASVAMGIFVYFSLQFSAQFLNTRTFFGIFVQSAIAGFFGLASFTLFAVILKIRQFQEIFGSLIKFR